MVSLRVTAEQRKHIRIAAAENHTDVAGLLRDAIESYVADFRDDPVFRLKPAPP